MAKKMRDLKLVEVAGGADLAVENGDFVVVESKLQHNQNLIYTNKGEWKENPTIAVGAIKYIDGDNPRALLSMISSELIRDGMDVLKVGLKRGGDIDVNGYYK